ncbi:anthrax toxin receptor-like isoform X4 [Apodemus sylvaticus]|uniref:anthrax toxin receptor-like isoform X4 n=1 Tax=Apodemus sylvaticus TaxID=10129 RepID=UPI002244E86B|nr:anthrax toxin receptor-like isoform X4 [Apodemus sylvaticus]
MKLFSYLLFTTGPDESHLSSCFTMVCSSNKGAGCLKKKLMKDWKTREANTTLPACLTKLCHTLTYISFVFRSGSVGDNWIHIYSFVEGLVKKFTNPNLRLSIITYSTEAEVILPLTSDRNKINKGLLVLKNIEPLGLTHMQKGLKKANEQIRRTNLRGRKVNSVIIALTDGLLLLKPYVDTIEEVSPVHRDQRFASGVWGFIFSAFLSFQAKRARKMGAIIYTVGVFMYSKQQLVNIAGDPNHCFGVDEGFAALEKVIDPPTFVCAKGENEPLSTVGIYVAPGNKRKHLCLEKIPTKIALLTSPQHCHGQHLTSRTRTDKNNLHLSQDTYQVNVNGHGFNNTNDVKQVICRFTFNDARVVAIVSR